MEGVEEVMLEKMRCPRCGYIWYTKSKRLYVICPNCYYTFKRERGRV